MTGKIKYVVIAGVIAVAAFALRGICTNGCGNGVCGLFSAPMVNAASNENSDRPSGTEQIAFVELGSVNCIPCKQMKPVMDAIEKNYKGKVKVVFHDVWTAEGKKYSEQYRIRLIPTQVFLNREGTEVARHEGFFPQEQIEALLAEQGVTS